MTKNALIAAAAMAAGLMWWVTPATAAGNLAARPVDIKLTVDRDLKPSDTIYQLETGKYVRWTIRNDAPGEEIRLMAPDLWRYSYLNYIKIGENEVFPLGLYAVEIDEDNEVLIFFVPIQPGDYDWWIKGQESRGLKGKFVVR